MSQLVELLIAQSEQHRGVFTLTNELSPVTSLGRILDLVDIIVRDYIDFWQQ